VASLLEPTTEDENYGWKINVHLINQISQELTYPAHPLAIEQIILLLVKEGIIKDEVSI
jgi:hypothetical protein